MLIIQMSARIFLFGVFAVAGVTKLADLAGFRATVAAFGAPRRLAPGLSLALPTAELTSAALLLTGAWAWWGGALALALLLVFSAAIVVALRRGSNPDCHCFGALSAQPVSGRTLARNGVFAACAIAITASGPAARQPSVLAWLAGLTGAGVREAWLTVLLLAVAAVQFLLLYALVVQHGRLLLRMDALEARTAPPAGTPVVRLGVGAAAPVFELPSPAGELAGLESLLRGGRPVMLLFADTGCPACGSVLKDAGVWQARHAEHLRLVIVSRTSDQDIRRAAAEHGLRDVLLQTDHVVAAAYGVAGTPGAIVVRADGTIGSEPALGRPEIEQLLDTWGEREQANVERRNAVAPVHTIGRALGTAS